MLCPVCRALRQNREAAALGLLEGHKQRGGEDGDIEVCSHAHPSSCHYRDLHIQPCTVILPLVRVRRGAEAVKLQPIRPHAVLPGLPVQC